MKVSEDEKLLSQRKKAYELEEEDKEDQSSKIFDGLVIYINGSTYPLISDHKLKCVLAENGAKLSIHLGRRQVTHVILGRPSGTQGLGAGGGLAGSKIEKEIRRIGGCGVKYVGVEWLVYTTAWTINTLTITHRVLESIKVGKRLSEAQYTNLKVAAKGQQSVYSMFQKSSSNLSSEGAASKS